MKKIILNGFIVTLRISLDAQHLPITDSIEHERPRFLPHATSFMWVRDHTSINIAKGGPHEGPCMLLQTLVALDASHPVQTAHWCGGS
jgi:hypothetical protein